MFCARVERGFVVVAVLDSEWFWHCITLSFTVLQITEGFITQEKCFTLSKLYGRIALHE